MNVIRDVPALRELVRTARSRGDTIGFVPTMGALHEGHFSLVRQARRDCGFVVVSIFVNPLQFAPGEDFASYPRQPEEDEKRLAARGVDLLYRPDEKGFYSPDFSSAVEVRSVSEGGEAAVRPGHFRGVATVVTKLFLQVTPDVAYFGRKDLQQVAVVRRLLRDLDFPIRLVVCETIREQDGLALSSRNAYLSPDERKRAAALSRALSAARAKVAGGERDSATLERETRAELEKAGLSVDYVEAVECETMRRPKRIAPGVALAAAIRLGKTRLIDNVLLLDE
jgi:pantoate--beta-alanine ligase